MNILLFMIGCVFTHNIVFDRLLGVALMNAEAGYSFAYALLNGLCSGAGFLLAVVLMAGVREKLEFSRIPAPFKGMPITLISAGLIALAFIGFKGMA